MNQKSQDKYSFANIKGEIYPYLQEALKKLLDEVTKNQQVTKYQMKLAKKKIYDKCQRKFIEKERLRFELADQYESSQSQQQIDYEYLGISKPEMKKLIRERLRKDNFNPALLEQRPENNPPPPVQTNVLLEIKQKEEDEEERTARSFNPIMFLADEMERLYKHRITN